MAFSYRHVTALGKTTEIVDLHASSSTFWAILLASKDFSVINTREKRTKK